MIHSNRTTLKRKTLKRKRSKIAFLATPKRKELRELGVTDEQFNACFCLVKERSAPYLDNGKGYSLSIPGFIDGGLPWWDDCPYITDQVKANVVYEVLSQLNEENLENLHRFITKS